MAPKSKLSDETLDLLLRSCGAELRRTSQALVETSLEEHRNTSILRAVHDAAAAEAARRSRFAAHLMSLKSGWTAMVMPARVAFVCVLMLSIAVALKHPTPRIDLHPAKSNGVGAPKSPAQRDTVPPENMRPDTAAWSSLSPEDTELASAYASLNTELASVTDFDSETNEVDQDFDGDAPENGEDEGTDGDDVSSTEARIVEPAYESLSDNFADVQQSENADYETDLDDAA